MAYFIESFILIIIGYLTIWFILKRIILRWSTSKKLMFGKTVVITGANTGIGKATAQELVKRHARVIMACRDTAKATEAAVDIRKVTRNGELVIKQLNLMSFKSVREFCEEVLQEEKKIDVLINNAGVFNHPFMMTEDGVEVHMAVNHFSNFLLTHLLLDRIRGSSPSRIVFVNSFFYKRGKLKDINDVNMNCINSSSSKILYSKYADSKLANVYFARELDRRLQDSGISVHIANPGVVHTQIGRHTTPAFVDFIMTPVAWLIKSPLEGCQTVLHCAISDELDDISGRFYTNCQEEPWNQVCSNEDISEKIWELSESVTKLTRSELIPPLHN